MKIRRARRPGVQPAAFKATPRSIASRAILATYLLAGDRRQRRREHPAIDVLFRQPTRLASNALLKA